MRYPGTIVVEFLDPLPTGLSRREFIDLVSERIETASNRLIEAGRREQAELFGTVPSAIPPAPAALAAKPEREQLRS
jgi:1-acyl-sn-glycerol-3-phosphate acyltransferase